MKKAYIVPEIESKSLLIESILLTLSNEKTGSPYSDIQKDQLSGGNNYSTGDGIDAGAKHGTIDWDF